MYVVCLTLVIIPIKVRPTNYDFYTLYLGAY